MLEKRLSNDALLSTLSATWRDENVLVARIIVMLMEVEERRLHLELACSSMFDFATRRLGMSEGEAFRRITAARLAKRFPQVLAAIRAQRIHLSSLVLLRDVLTLENVDALLTAASGKTTRAVQELVAKLAPRPDARAFIRELPVTRLAQANAHAAPPQLASASASAPAPAPTMLIGIPASPASASEPLARRPPQLVPLAEARHKVQFTASSALREKLERAQSLLRHRNPDGDLAIVVERALDLLITKLEREKLGATARPKAPSANANAKTARVRAVVRREVIQRDGEQCSFTGPKGERCPARSFLELDHRQPRALGGANDAANLRVLCREHNQHAAERLFGREHMARARDARRAGASESDASPKGAAGAGAGIRRAWPWTRPRGCGAWRGSGRRR